MKHIRNYTKVRKAIDAYYRLMIDRMEKELATLEADGSDTEAISQRREMLAKPTTTKTGKVKYPKTGYHRWWHDDLVRLDRADKAGKVYEITFKIEWKKSRTWGSCPSCETWVHYEGEPQNPVISCKTGKPLLDTDGNPMLMSTHYNPRTYASGCGYDKRSTVMDEGIQCPAVDRLIIEHEKCWSCYAVRKNALPQLDFGGKGVETLRQLFKVYGEKPPIPGFEWTWEEGRSWDFIHIVRKERK